MLYIKGNRASRALRGFGGRLRGRVARSIADSDLHPLLEDPVGFMYSNQVTILKNSKRSRVVRAKLGGHDVVIKESQAITRVKAFKRSLIPSRAARGWHAAQTVLALGLATPRPFAYIECRRPPCWGRSWLITEWVSGPNLLLYLTQYEPDEAQRAAVIDAVVQIYASLHQSRVTHADARPVNFIIHDGQPVVIDLDCAIRHPRLSPVFCRFTRRDVLTMLRNWRRAGETDMEARFERAFEAAGYRFLSARSATDQLPS